MNLVHILLVLLLIGIVILAVQVLKAPDPDADPAPKEIVLEPGNYSWEVYIQGSRTIWHLAYANYNTLPVHNQDYPAVIVHNGTKYNLYRVYTSQIRVSAPVG